MKLRDRDGYFHLDESHVTALGKTKRIQRTTNVKIPDKTDKAAYAEAHAFALGVAAKIYAKAIAEASPEDAPKSAKASETLAEGYDLVFATLRVEKRSKHTLTATEGAWNRVRKVFRENAKAAETIDAAALIRYAQAQQLAGYGDGTLIIDFRLIKRIRRVLSLPPIAYPKIQEPDPVRRTITPEQSLQILELARNAGRRDHLIMYRALGIRSSELWRIQREDVHLDEGYVFVNGTKTKPSQRDVPLHAMVAEVLERRLRERPADQPLFEKWSHSACWRALNRWARKAGVPHGVSLNDFRRSFTTDLLLAGASDNHVATFLGHGSTTMISKVYGRLHRRKGELIGTVNLLPF
jgi:integrase